MLVLINTVKFTRNGSDLVFVVLRSNDHVFDFLFGRTTKRTRRAL
jgi:hypothetical protein